MKNEKMLKKEGAQLSPVIVVVVVIVFVILHRKEIKITDKT